MKAMKPVFFVILLMIVVLGLQQSLFIVDQTQQALVIQLGHPLDKVYRPGLHFKIPAYGATYCMEADSPAEALTSDLKSIVLDNYARWKIVDPLRFYRTMRTEHNAQARLDAVIYSQIRAHIGRHTLTQVVADERTSIMDSVHLSYWQQNPAVFGVYACLGVGFLVGLVTVSKLLTQLFARRRAAAFFAIAGLSLGSAVTMFFNPDVFAVYTGWAESGVNALDLSLGLVLFVLGLVVAYLFVRYERKKSGAPKMLQ